MGGNSLLIYYYEIARKLLKQKPNLQPDTDYTKCIFEDGVLSFHGTDSIEKRLNKVGVLKEKRSGSTSIVYEMNFTVSQERITELRAKLKAEQERAISILRPSAILVPEIYEQLRHILKRIFECVRKMNAFERDFNGLVMTNCARDMLKSYRMINSGLIDEKAGWSAIYEKADYLIYELSFTSDLRIWRQDVIVSIGADIIQLKRLLEKKLEADGKASGK